MASKYFTSLSFARAKKNKEELEKSNPQEPVLKDEDEKFLNKHISSDEAVPAATLGQDVPATKIADDGEEKEASKEEQERAGDSVVVPETQPKIDDAAQDAEPSSEAQAETGDGAQDGEQSLEQTSNDEVMKEKAGERVKARKAKKENSMDLPSQEDAEAATRGKN